MSEQLVLCGPAGARRGDALRLALGGQSGVALKIDDIARPIGANVPPVLTDLVELAAYVYCADQSVARGGETGRGGGKGWRRSFRCIVPVREPELWSGVHVLAVLRSALAFLTDDTWEFEFERLEHPPPFQSYLGLDRPLAKGVQADEVVLFSGGLDSLGGAISRLRAGNSVVLVSHRASTKLLEHQRHLAGVLAERYPGRVVHAPIAVYRKGERAAEYTQRTRAFLFASLAAAIGHLTGSHRFLFCDNGVVSLNLPLAGQVVGARASRTTHPEALHGLQRFLSALLGRTIGIENPFLWHTRAEVVGSIAEAGFGNLVRHTVSCSRVRAMTSSHTHCGTCFQCIDRRFATLAAGVGEDDPPGLYGVDLLVGSRQTDEAIAMTELYLRHHRDLLAMSDLLLQARFGLEIGRAAPFVGRPTTDAAARDIVALHRRQALGVRGVLTDAVRTNADALLGGALPASCVLRLALGAGDVSLGAEVERDHAERRGAVPTPPPGDGDCPELPELRIAVDDSAKRVRVQGVPKPINGPTAVLLAKLAAMFREDMARGRLPANYRCRKAKTLACELGVEEATLRRQVSRLRRAITRAIEEACGLSTSGDVLIESKGWQGYRLNPHVRLVSMGEWPLEVTASTAARHNT